VFDVGFNELVLIFIIGLLVLGPQRLPKVAAEIGKWVGRARRTANELRRQLEREIELNDIQPPPSGPSPADVEKPAPAPAPAPTDATLPAPAAVPPPAEPHADAAAAAESASASPSAAPEAPPAAADPETANVPEPIDRPPHA
jgi:sec-independent protein translocase protein TatB